MNLDELVNWNTRSS